MNIIKAVLPFVAVFFLSGCYVFGTHDVAIAPYSVVKSEGSFEIRKYKPMIVAETTVTDTNYKDMGEIAFRRLFKYITGNNTSGAKVAMTAPVLQEPASSGEKIAMTAPVFMDQKDKKWTMRFVLPESYTMKTAPRPNDPTVTLSQIPAKKTAVIVFQGFLNEEAITEKTAELKEWVKKNKLSVQGAPVIAGYDPPWTLPMFRRNEILMYLK